MNHRILIVEDDPDITLLLREQLRFEGFEVETAPTTEAGFTAAMEHEPSLVVLDLLLPDGNGFELCARLREAGVSAPVLILTARDQAVDKVRGLDLGADDYVTKPFDIHEVLARVRALLRRSGTAAEVEGVYRVAELAVDVPRRLATRSGEPLALTKTEFEILLLLVRRAGEVVSRNDFLDQVWSQEYLSYRTIDSHVASLRKKLGATNVDDSSIQTVRGVGYRLHVGRS